MTQYRDQAWEASEFITEFAGLDGYDKQICFKLLETPREAWDGPDADEANAHWLIGIDDGGVRRVDIVLDTACGREIEDHDGILNSLIKAKSTPFEAIEILKQYAD